MAFFRKFLRNSDNLLIFRNCNSVLKNKWIGESIPFSKKIEIPEPPKRPLSAYMIFCKENRPILLKENPALSSTDQIKRLAEKWGLLDKEMKKPYEVSARENTLLYGEAHKIYYENLSEEQKEEITRLKKRKKETRRQIKLKKALEESGLPRPSVSAYNLFVQSVSKDKGGINNAKEFIKEAAEKWKSLPNETKKTFQDLAISDKTRYATELKQWRKKLEDEDQQELLKEYDEFKGKKNILSEEILLEKISKPPSI